MIRQTVYLAALLMSVVVPGLVMAEDTLRREFLCPPVAAKAWCYWWWLNGAASKEGITRDFEEMKKQGISGALLFDAGEAGPDAPRGPHFMSPEWRELYKHALREADRCGIVLTVNLCSGWNAGGPWVTHEHAAKKLVSAQTVVKGPGHVTATLPQPQAVQGFYRDIVVLAARIPDDAVPACELIASSQYQDYGPALAEDGNDETRWVSNGYKAGMGPTPERPEFLQFNFAQPWAAAGLLLKPYSDCGPQDVEVQCSDDGKAFRSLARATLKPREEQTLAFDETQAQAQAKHFRILFLSSQPYRGGNWNVQVAEIALLSKEQVAGKRPPTRFLWNLDSAVDLTRFVDQDGRLDWEAPAGSWKIQRIGCTLHGNITKCVGSGPAGLEIDVMSAEAMDAHFAETGAKLIADAGPLAGKTLQYFHIDSWELGMPTWTPKMREEFQRRRGYDPFPWLPAVLGQTVNDAADTQRFVRDYRRTAADLVAANYYGRLEELTVKGGLRGTHSESGGPFFTQWIDALQCLGTTAIPMGEFWSGRHQTVKQAANAAHIYGKPLCQAEAFTSMSICDWTADPWGMKNIGDSAFCDGLTRNVLCFWIHQSRLDAKPGFQWAHVGTHFDCNLIWWPMADGWLTYLARCQHMLRQGRFVADYAFLREETVPDFVNFNDAVKQAGFDYDWLNREVLLTRASAKDGRLTLPDGMTYRYLVLPDGDLSAEVLKKVNELAEAGVTVVGPKSLEKEVGNLRAGDWRENTARADKLAPDIEFPVATGAQPSALAWIHRSDGETDLYFISNQSEQDVAAQIVFRLAGRQPELWDAVTGEVRTLPEHKQTEDKRTELPMEFAPKQSWFVVFRSKGSGFRDQGSGFRDQGSGLRDQGSECRDQGSAKNFPEVRPVTDVAGPWEVSFDPSWFYPDNGTGGKVRFDSLEDWSQRPEEAVRHYSGIAVYRRTFDLPASTSGLKPVYLSLGEVKSVARVCLNGRDLGVVWTAPRRVAVPAGMLKDQGNALEIAVANRWPNRLIGDAALPPDKRRTITNVRTYDTMTTASYGCRVCAERKQTGKPAELLPSGLLGPVQVLAEE